MTAEHDVLPPLQLDSYEYTRRIAVGGMAEIFLAWQKGPGGFRRQVAIKHALPQLTADPEFVSLFLREAHIAASLTHPNIVSVLEVLNPEDTQCLIVMEYVRGPNMRSLLNALVREGHVLPIEVTIHAVTSICAALHHAYNSVGVGSRPRHIVHRDVTPTNILLSRAGHVKLGDFGIARTYAAESVTRTGVVRGKAAYMSPEQTRGEPLDQRSDLFSVGVLLYEMATGVQPFHRPGNQVATVQSLLYEPIPDPSSYAPNLSSGLRRVMLRALARDREERYTTAEELAADLRLVVEDADGGAAALAALIGRVFPDDASVDAVATRENRDGLTGARTTVVVTRSRRGGGDTPPKSAAAGPPPTPAPAAAAMTAPPVAARRWLTPVLLALVVISAVFWMVLILSTR